MPTPPSTEAGVGGTDNSGTEAGRPLYDCLSEWLSTADYSPETVRAYRSDIIHYSEWHERVNGAAPTLSSVSTRDVRDYRDQTRAAGSAVSSVNRRLNALRQLFRWGIDGEMIERSPCYRVQQLRAQALAPRCLSGPSVRRLLREAELRRDLRALAVFVFILGTGARSADVVALRIEDVELRERSGRARFARGKGRKERHVPLPLAVRAALSDYLAARGAGATGAVFLGRRGPLCARGLHRLCARYGRYIGETVAPHLLRHTMAHRFLSRPGNDLVSLAQILGHEDLNTTARYTMRSEAELAEQAERMEF